MREIPNFLDLFHHTFLSNEIGLMKPDLKIFTYVSKALNIEPSEIFFIDDNKYNIDAAKKVGFKVFHSSNFADIQKKVELI